MNNITFINASDNQKDELIKRAREHLNEREDDLDFYCKFSYPFEYEDLRELLKEEIEHDTYYSFSYLRSVIEKYEEVGGFDIYGLGFNFVEAKTFGNQNQGYYRFQLSFGGPTEEIRFFVDNTIEFVYLDWGCGIGFDISSEHWAEQLKNYFEEIEVINFENIPYEELYGVSENEENE